MERGEGMKQLTHNLLKINFSGINLTDVEKIEIAFSQNIASTPLKTNTYPSNDVLLVSENAVGVVWTPEETALFKSDSSFYLDTRITMKDSPYQPPTPIVKLKMDPTLFEQG